MSATPLGLRVLAGLLTWYALTGFTIALLVALRGTPVLDWRIMSSAGVLLGLTTGTAALAVWRGERKAIPALLVSAGAAVLFCLALPLSFRGSYVPPGTWRMAIIGALMFAAFLTLAAAYVRLRLSAPGGR